MAARLAAGPVTEAGGGAGAALVTAASRDAAGAGAWNPGAGWVVLAGLGGMEIRAVGAGARDNRISPRVATPKIIVQTRSNRFKRSLSLILLTGF
jgi:hypothetical protein